jgi:hypothetical protein
MRPLVVLILQKVHALAAGALFLITFLSKGAILRVLPARAGVPQHVAWLRSGPSSQPRRLRTSIYAGAFSSPAPEERGWLLTGGGETRSGYTITSPPSSRQDPGILAQQSDVRCKIGRLYIILIAPAAHTSKGLAKSLVSSAGGKGPEYPGSPAPLYLRSEA